jgi:hypothetical protein
MRLIPRLMSRKPDLRRCRRPVAPPATAKLRLERLEDRAVPAFGLGWAFHVGGLVGDSGQGVAVDGGGNVYVTGNFNGANVNFDPLNPNPAPSAYLSSNPAFINQETKDYDAFVAEYTPGGRLLWATALGQFGSTDGPTSGPADMGIAVQGTSVYVAFAHSFTEDNDPLIVAKLDAANGGALAWAVSLPGAGYSAWTGVAVGPSSGDLYVTGGNAASQAVVARLDPASGATVWAATTSGGSAEGNGVAVYDDPTSGAESVYLTGGYTGTASFGATPLTSLSGSTDAFVWKLNSDGTTTGATGLGTSGGDYGYGIAVDGAGNAYVTGGWNGNRFGTQIFVAKFNPSLVLSWAGYIGGGAAFEAGYGIAVDSAGNVYATGAFAGSVDFDPGPGKIVLQSGNHGKSLDVFVWELNASGGFVTAADIAQGTGGITGRGRGIALDSASGAVYTTGQFKGTADFDPTAGTYYLTTNSGSTSFSADAFVSKLTQSGLKAAAIRATAAPAAVLLPGAEPRPIVAAAADGPWVGTASGANALQTPTIPAAPVLPPSPSADALPAWLGWAGPRKRPSALFADRLTDPTAEGGSPSPDSR